MTSVVDYDSFSKGLAAPQTLVSNLMSSTNVGDKIIIVYSWECPHCIQHRNLYNRLKLLYDLDKWIAPHWVICMEESQGKQVGQAQKHALEKIGIAPKLLPAIYINHAETPKVFTQVPDEILDEMANAAKSQEEIAIGPLYQYFMNNKN